MTNLLQKFRNLAPICVMSDPKVFPASQLLINMILVFTFKTRFFFPRLKKLKDTLKTDTRLHAF